LAAADAQKYEENFVAYSAKIADGVRGLVRDLRQRQAAGNPAIARVRLAVDEWGLVRDWNVAPDGPGLGPFEHYYALGDAITVGRGLHELVRSCDLVAMANWAQTVNVIGAIKTNRTAAVLDPVGHLLALYRACLNGHLVPLAPVGDAPVDAVAGWDAQAATLTIGLINYS